MYIHYKKDSDSVLVDFSCATEFDRFVETLEFLFGKAKAEEVLAMTRAKRRQCFMPKDN